MILCFFTRGRYCVTEILFFSITHHLLGPYPHLIMILKELKMEGFMQSRWNHKNEESLKRMMGWLKEVSDWKRIYYDAGANSEFLCVCSVKI